VALMLHYITKVPSLQINRTIYYDIIWRSSRLQQGIKGKGDKDKALR